MDPTTPDRDHTPTQRLADHLLGDDGPLAAFVAQRRSGGRSWRLVARELYDATGGEIDVTYETLRSWFAENEPAA